MFIGTAKHKKLGLQINNDKNSSGLVSETELFFNIDKLSPNIVQKVSTQPYFRWTGADVIFYTLSEIRRKFF